MVSDDALLRSELESIIMAASVDCFICAQGEHLTERVKSFNPFLLIADVRAENSGWIYKHASEIKIGRTSLPMIACIAGSSESQRMRAQSAGFDHVLTKDALIKNLPKLLLRYLR